MTGIHEAMSPHLDAKSPGGTIRLTTAEALVRWMVAQRSELLDGSEVPLFAGVFAIFGHGNVLGLGTALHAVRDQLPTWRGQAEEGMALAAVGYTKAMDRRQVMAATTSVGPGALNMVTAAGVAHANRLPVLLLPGDTFTGRAPDPVLQQVEHFGDLTTSVNDAFRAVARYFDRITRPEQLLATLPQVARVLTDPADAGPVVLALPQDVQAELYDFPVAMFASRVHRIPRPRADARSLAEGAAILRDARRPLLVLGGGARYSGAVSLHGGSPKPTASRSSTRRPGGRSSRMIIRSTEGRSGSSALRRPMLSRSRRTSSSPWARGSRTSRRPRGRSLRRDVRLISINAARFDAVKHAGHAIVGDARANLEELDRLLLAWTAPPAWSARAASERAVLGFARWTSLREGVAPDGSLTYAQVVGAVNDESGPDDYVLTSSGGMPGELHGGWRAVAPVAAATAGATMDLEYGFSCMGYELSGAWGAAMARSRTHPAGVVTTLLGDGSYLMLNSDLYSAAFAGHPFVAVVCDNGGYAVIHRLQTGQGAEGFNNLLADAAGPGATEDPVRVDFASHARSLGCSVESVPADGGVDDLRAAYRRARATAMATRRPVVVTCRTHPAAWTEAGAWWEVGVPASLAGRGEYERAKIRQLRWVAPDAASES